MNTFMNLGIVKFLIVSFLLVFAYMSQAQNSNFSNLPNVGLSSPILDNGTGFHIAVNPSYSLTPYFAAEAQVSYVYTSISSTFLSGNMGSTHALNTLIGGRLYLRAEDKTVRPYLNLLVGVNYLSERFQGNENDSGFYLGLSSGAFIQIRQVVMGISFDTPQYMVLKLGYTI